MFLHFAKIIIEIMPLFELLFFFFFLLNSNIGIKYKELYNSCLSKNRFLASQANFSQTKFQGFSSYLSFLFSQTYKRCQIQEIFTYFEFQTFEYLIFVFHVLYL